MARLQSVLILSVCLAACAPDQQQTAIQIDFDPDSQTVETIEVRGLDRDVLGEIENADLSEAEWASIFAVFTADSGSVGVDLPPVAGAYTIDRSAIRFRPSYPFVADLPYRVRFDPAGLAVYLDTPNEAPSVGLDSVFVVTPHRSADSEEARITAVYPSADHLPANQLKFYVHFSAPMAEGQAYSSVRLIDERSNDTVEAAFLEMEPELWDPTRQRFTLLVNPGRVKRDVGPNREVGVPLETGVVYRLEIDKRWLDAGGRPLAIGFAKTFRALPPDRTMLDSDQWVVEVPPAGSRSPLVLTFGEPLDHALLDRVITIHRSNSGRVEGHASTTDAERSWLFTPTEAWQPGDFEIRVETILEDLAGNSVRSLFDVDLEHERPSTEREAEQVRVIPFAVETYHAESLP